MYNRITCTDSYMHIPAEIFQGHFPAEEMGWSLVPKSSKKNFGGCYSSTQKWQNYYHKKPKSNKSLQSTWSGIT